MKAPSAPRHHPLAGMVFPHTHSLTEQRMSSANTVAFEYADRYPGEVGEGTGYNYTFYFVNNTSNSMSTTAVTFNYDVTSLASAADITGGSISGTVDPQSTSSVTFFLGAPNAQIQYGAAPLLTVGDFGTVCFWFSTNGGSDAEDQQIAICSTGNGTTLPISSFSTQTSSEQVACSSTTGLSVTLNAGGNAQNTSNIYIQLGNGS
jgi:hypothetical protein